MANSENAANHFFLYNLKISDSFPLRLRPAQGGMLIILASHLKQLTILPILHSFLLNANQLQTCANDYALTNNEQSRNRIKIYEQH